MNLQSVTIKSVKYLFEVSQALFFFSASVVNSSLRLLNTLKIIPIKSLSEVGFVSPGFTGFLKSTPSVEVFGANKLEPVLVPPIAGLFPVFAKSPPDDVVPVDPVLPVVP